MLENILTYSLSSIFGGIVISVACVVLLLMLIKVWSKNSLFSPFSFLAAGILFLILAYNCTGICSAFAMKSDVDFIESMISQMINISIPNHDTYLNQEATSDVIKQIITGNPILNYFFDSTNFGDCTLKELPQVIASKLHDSLNSMILKKFIWSVAFMVIGAVVIVKTMDSVVTSRHKSSTSRYSSERVSSRNRRPVSRRR